MPTEYGFPPADQMQADIDAIGSGTSGRGGPTLPPPGVQPPDPAAMQNMMQAMMQQKMQIIMTSFQQAAQGADASGTSPPAASSPLKGTHWRQDSQMANVCLDERAFRRLDKFTNKKDEWKEWRTQFPTAVRECDTGFGTSFIAYEKAEDPIEDTGLTPTLQQNCRPRCRRD